jgi:tetratricopeptide (TPR) repeat protein
MPTKVELKRIGPFLTAALLGYWTALAGAPIDYAQIQRAIQERRLSSAQQTLETHLAVEPGDFRAHLLLGIVYSEQNQMAKSVQHLRHAIRLRPQEPAPHNSLGLVLMRQKKPAEALSEFKTAVGLAPRDLPVWLNLFQAQLSMKKFDDAQSSAEKIGNLAEPSGDLYNRLGALQAEFGDYPGAIKHLERAAAIDTGSYDLRYNLGLAYYRNGDLIRALQILESLHNQRDTGEIENLLGEVYEKKGQYLEAVRAFQKATELEPANEGYRFDFAYELLAHKNFDAAVAVAAPAVNEFSNSLRLRLALGVAYFGVQRFDRSSEVLLDTAKKFPDSEMALRLLAMTVDISPTEPQQVLALISGYLKRHPGQFWPYYFMGRKAYRNGDFHSALALLKQSVTRAPNDADSQFELGNAYFQLERWTEAIQSYQRAVQIKPDLAEAYYRLFRAYRQSGQPAKAKEALRIFQKVKPKDAESPVMQFVYTLQK